MEASLDSRIKFNYAELMLNVRSLPIFGQKYKYWDTLIGARSSNIAEKLDSKYFSDWHFYFQYSPFYGGEYDVKKTYGLGTSIGFSDHLSLDIYTSGKFYINTSVKLRLENFEFSLYNKKDSYDDFFVQEARSIGLNSRFQF